MIFLDFDDIRHRSSKADTDNNSLGSPSCDVSFPTSQSPLRGDSPDDCQNSITSSTRPLLSSKVSGDPRTTTPKRADQLDKILSSALGGRASVPIAPSKHVQGTSATCFTPKVSIQSNFSSADSLISTSAGATTTNTTSNRTTRSGSDLFKSDSSGFSKPLVPPGKRRNTVSRSTATDDYETLPAFSYTLSLSVLRHSSEVEKTDIVEFKMPDFTKTVTWQSRVQRMNENAAAAVSEAAKVLADSLEDWLRELFTSDSEEPRSDYKQTPATVIARRRSICDARVSSSSSEYFFPRLKNVFTKTLNNNARGPLSMLLLFLQIDFLGNITNQSINTGQQGGAEPKSSEGYSDPNDMISDSGSQDGAMLRPVTALDTKTRRKSTLHSTSLLKDKSGVKTGVLVYAKWYANKFFYAGQIIGNPGEDRFRVLFDDNSKLIVSGKNIILADLLPIGADVYADISGKNEFEVGYLVSGHVVGTTPLSYIVKRIEDNEVFQLERKRVAILLEPMKRLLAAGHLLTMDRRSDICSVMSDTPSFISPTSSSSPSNHVSPRGVSARVITSGTAVGSSVRRKRVFTEVGRSADRAVPAKRLMRRKTAPQHQRDPSVSASSPVPRRLGSAKQRTRSRAKASAQRQEFTRKHSGFSRRDSQIWIAGRRVVARASRASVCFISAPHSCPRRKKAPRTRPFRKQQQSSPPPDNTITSSPLAPSIEISVEQQEASSPIIPSLPRLSSGSSVLVKDQSMRTVGSEEFRQTCRLYRIPLPHPDLFSKWYIVRTTGVNPADLKSIQITFSSPHARTQFSACKNASFLRLLISAGGGQSMEMLEADCVSSTGRLVGTEGGNVVSKEKHPRIALIAPSAKRTVKFLQGLATLGRVPLLHPAWLLDACFLAAGRKPLVADPEVASKIADLGIEPADIPFELLRLSPRTLYELPRGVDRVTNQTILPDIVPPWFIEPMAPFRPKTLATLGGYASSKIVAVVTDDFRGFGEGWLSILRHAMYTASGPPAADKMPSIITSAESVEKLNTLRTAGNASNCKLNIVLVDQGRIPEAGVSQIESMGFVVINQEFLIQSLIHGRMLDLKYGTAWKT
ncbi:TP53-binding protein 1 [Taenia crassiceps]|uniref:TP53-binding protein 1 n=1 Tax=Taenia crassiceps TaxID=6207 RepID=A0ABR4Q8X4_9CEST